MKKGRFTLPLFCAALFVNCTGELPLSDLLNDSITLKFLGTYESNDPYGDLSLSKDDVINAGITGNTNWNAASDIYNYANGLTVSRVKYYIDIAEIRIAQGQGKSGSQSISDYWNQFAISRELLCSDYATVDSSRHLPNCSSNNGIQKLYDFFNGGYSYKASDVTPGTYNHLGIYFRRFNTYPAARFNAAGQFINASGSVASQDASEQSMTTAFDNNGIYGFDMENLLLNPYGGAASEPLMFPLQRKDLSIQVPGNNEPYVLEVRVFLKNLMMAHVIQGGDGTGIVYVGPSDWNIDHKYQDTYNSVRMGGSVLLTARTYEPASVGSIAITGGNANEYFAAVPAGSAFNPLTALPLAATSATTGVIKNLMPGSYDVYRTCDQTKCGTASTAGTCSTPVPGQDGFPEKAVSCGPAVAVTKGTTTNFGACGSSC
ncbi:MAG: hypothetical protein LDLANPLL_00612 [Turneriella sp.]|nr:hypothetical protein [Turneriella sp.]